MPYAAYESSPVLRQIPIAHGTPSSWRWLSVSVVLALRPPAGAVALDRMGLVRGNVRTDRAREALVAKRSADGWWAVEYQWWNPPGHCTFPEVVAWPGVGAPNPFVTIHALAILA